MGLRRGITYWLVVLLCPPLSSTIRGRRGTGLILVLPWGFGVFLVWVGVTLASVESHVFGLWFWLLAVLSAWVGERWPKIGLLMSGVLLLLAVVHAGNIFSPVPW